MLELVLKMLSGLSALLIIFSKKRKNKTTILLRVCWAYAAQIDLNLEIRVGYCQFYIVRSVTSEHLTGFLLLLLARDFTLFKKNTIFIILVGRCHFSYIAWAASGCCRPHSTLLGPDGNSENWSLLIIGFPSKSVTSQPSFWT